MCAAVPIKPFSFQTENGSVFGLAGSETKTVGRKARLHPHKHYRLRFSVCAISKTVIRYRFRFSVFCPPTGEGDRIENGSKPMGATSKMVAT